jgi:hypothetical protein
MASCSVSSSTGLRPAGAGLLCAVRAARCGAGVKRACAPTDALPLSRADSVSSAVATTSTPVAVGRLDRMSVPSPNAMRALARASRDVGA